MKLLTNTPSLEVQEFEGVIMKITAMAGHSRHRAMLAAAGTLNLALIAGRAHAQNELRTSMINQQKVKDNFRS